VKEEKVVGFVVGLWRRLSGSTEMERENQKRDSEKEDKEEIVVGSTRVRRVRITR
jgi:hypothetical protein